jgi:hypothetical protein
MYFQAYLETSHLDVANISNAWTVVIQGKVLCCVMLYLLIFYHLKFKSFKKYKPEEDLTEFLSH